MKSYQQFLTEIGNSNRPYAFTLRIKPPRLDDEGSFIGSASAGTAEFKTAKKLEYFIEFDAWEEHGKKTIDISFGVEYWGRDDMEYRDALAATDQGLEEMFRVMATVVTATKRFLRLLYKKHGIKIDVLTFGSSDLGKNGIDRSKVAQRTKLYLAYAKKNLHDVKVIDTSSVGAEMEVLDKFYAKI